MERKVKSFSVALNSITLMVFIEIIKFKWQRTVIKFEKKQFPKAINIKSIKENYTAS